MRNKKLIQDAILFAIDAIGNELQTDPDVERNKTRAEIIKTLAEAYATVSGKERRQ